MPMGIAGFLRMAFRAGVRVINSLEERRGREGQRLRR
jgi:hypothetical protein